MSSRPSPWTNAQIAHMQRRLRSKGGKFQTPLATKKYVKRYIARNTEAKYQTSTLDNTTMAVTGTITKVMTVAQGDTDSTRDGDELKIKRITIRGSVNVNNTAVYNRTRLIIFQWKPDDTSLVPTVAMILNGTGNVTEIVEGITNHDRSNQFNILFDKTMNVNYYGVPQFHIRKTLKKFNTIQKFTAGASTGSGQIYALYAGDQVTNAPTLNLQTYMSFTDS